MPNAKTHFFVGFGAGAIIYCLIKKSQDQPIELPGLLGMGLVGGAAALLPDMLEPATSPNHRELAHSLTAFVAIGTGAIKLNDTQLVEPAQKELGLVLAIGYLSHLFLDAGTPAGLPII